MGIVRFGIIGSNFIVDRFIKAAKLCENVEIRAIYSRDMDKANRLAKDKGIPLSFDNLESFSCCQEIDAVYIATPNSCHFEQTIMMLKAKKHVICEKPLASNFREASMMFQCAKDNGVFLMEAMRPVFHPTYQVIQEKLKEISPIRQVTLSYSKYSSRYDKFKQGIVENAFNPIFSNGSIMDIGCYPIHAMVMLFGLPKEIMAMGIKIPNSIDGNGNILANYGEFIANISYSKITDSYLRNEIQGENGTISFDDVTSPKNICYRDGNEVQAIEMPDLEDDMRYEIQKFINIAQNAEYTDTYQKYSLETLHLIDEVRSQMGIRFPADTLSEKKEP